MAYKLIKALIASGVILGCLALILGLAMGLAAVSAANAVVHVTWSSTMPGVSSGGGIFGSIAAFVVGASGGVIASFFFFALTAIVWLLREIAPAPAARTAPKPVWQEPPRSKPGTRGNLLYFAAIILGSLTFGTLAMLLLGRI